MANAIGNILPSAIIWAVKATYPISSESAGGGFVGAGLLDYGTKTYAGAGCAHIPQLDKWMLSDGSLLQSANVKSLGTRVHNRNGFISVRAPLEGAGSVIGVISASGVGSLTTTRRMSETGLFGGRSRALNVPVRDGCGMSTRVDWANPSAKIDLQIGATPRSPSYRVFGEGYYGPTGYWLTQNKTLRLGEVTSLEFFATDFELESANYALSVGGAVVATGTIVSGATFAYSTPFTTAGVYACSVTLTDANGQTATLPGPTITVFDAPVSTGAFDAPATTRVRDGRPVKVQISHSACSWKILDGTATLATGASTMGGASSFSWSPTPGVHQLSLVLSDSIGTSDPIAGPVITVVAWRDANIA